MNMSAQLVSLQQQVEDEQNRAFSNEQWRQRRYDDAPPWMKIPPENLRETRKKVGRFDYTWCPFHRLWQMHKPPQCDLNPKVRARRRGQYTSQGRRLGRENQRNDRHKADDQRNTNNDTLRKEMMGIGAKTLNISEARRNRTGE
jgi:hypothetical protein